MQVARPVDAVSLEATDATRLRLAAAFLSSIRLTAAAPSRQPSPQIRPIPAPAVVPLPQRLGSSTFVSATPRGSAEVERRGSGNERSDVGASWQAVAALHFLSNLRLT
eukprot:2252644-Prymnesium_polylepis.3